MVISEKRAKLWSRVGAWPAVSVDSVESPVGEVLRRQHRSVVAGEGCNGECLVGTKAHYSAHVARRRDSFDTVLISCTFNDAASDRLLLVLLLLLLMLMMMIIALMLRRVESNYFEAIRESITAESYLHFTIYTYAIHSVWAQSAVHGDNRPCILESYNVLLANALCIQRNL